MRTLADMYSHLQQGVPDILILDVELPDGNALHHIARIRMFSRRLGVVMLTRRRRSKDYVVGLTIGAEHFLAKPIALAELAATVTALTVG
jgi:DNA-binding response OmpR family regulator